VGRPIKLLLHSEDVIHSLFIPVFRNKIDVHPNRYTSYWFEATTPGEYDLYCAEYCGDQHSQMLARVRAVPEADYQEWKAKLLDTSGVPLLELGRKLYITKGCNACHSLDGAPGTGPTWKDANMHQTPMQDGSTVAADENYPRESILVPGAKIVAGFSNQMPVFMGKLTDRELLALITLIKDLSEAGKSEAEEAVRQDEADRAAREAGNPAP
jgi:cytochrome c oxidase subunit 2